MIAGCERESRPAFSEAVNYGPPRQSLRTRDAKYIRRLSDHVIPDPAHQDLPMTPAHELYDLAADPEERRNLAASNRDRLAAMQDFMAAIAPAGGMKFDHRRSARPGQNLADDAALMRRLRTLGYIR